MNSEPKTGIFIGGPHACATVYDMAHVEVVIKALCEVTGDDSEDYTATDLDNVHQASEEEVALIKAALL